MAAPFNEDLSDYTHQLAATATRANRLALENAESVFGMQLKTFEKNINAATGFLGQFAEIRDIGAYQTLLPQGWKIVRDNLDRLASANHEAVDLSLKTGEAIGQLARKQMEAASDRFQSAAVKAAKATRGR